MGCGAPVNGRKRSLKPTFVKQKKEFMNSPHVKFLKEVQSLIALAKGIVHLIDNEKKVKDNLTVFENAREIFDKVELCKPIGDLIAKLPEVLKPLIDQNKPIFAQIKPKA